MRLLGVFTPAGIEHFWKAIDELPAGTPADRVLAIARHHGLQIHVA